MRDIIELRRVWPYLKNYKGQFFIGIAMILLTVITSTLEPFILGLAITEIGVNIRDIVQGVPGAAMNYSYITKIMIIYGVRALFNMAGRFFSTYYISGVVQKSMFDLRNDISEKMNRLPVAYFDQHKLGDILSRVTSDIEAVSNFLTQTFSPTIIGLLQIILSLVMIATIRPQILIIVLAMIFISLIFSRFIIQWGQPVWKEQATALGNLFAVSQEHLSGFTEMKVYNQEEESLELFKATNRELAQAGAKASFRSGIVMPGTRVVADIAYVSVALISGLRVIQGTVTLGNLQALTQYVNQINQSMNQITQMSGPMQSAGAASARVFELLDQEEEDFTDESMQLPKEVKGEVVFEHVQFGYTSDNILMEDINFKVRAGETVAIVGPTGAGKTTLINLLLRYYELLDGSISIDGVDISKVSRHNLREHMGLVLQDTWLFRDSIFENIRFGNKDATEEEVMKAAKIANVDHFIRTLPDGYQEVINPDGDGISQGQRQLLTIARAVISDPDILILDEATSSVDTRLEQLIQDAMDRVMEGRTSFVIAHRLSTIRKADLILVMDQGNIIETGNHDELIAEGGFYADLYQSQFAD